MSWSEVQPVALADLEQLAAPPPPVDLTDAADVAQSLLAAARTEAELLRSQAVEDGRREGAEHARIEAAVALEPALSALAATAEQASALHDGLVEAAERRAAELGLAIAEKVVAGALGIEPDRVVDVVRGALRGILDGGRVVVCVHPDDVDIVRPAVEGHGSLGHIEIHEERRVARGGALVRTSQGEIDATAAAKLDRVRELVAAELSL